MVSPLPPEFYVQGRALVRPDLVLRDDPGPPPERWLQQVWRHQRLQRERLKTLDGRPVRVLHPGFWNREPGPDFRDAVVQICPEAPRRGDVELDLVVAGWRSHHHAGNPAYANVILHVVWDAAPADLAPPVLPLKEYLDAPLIELAPWLEAEAPGVLPGDVPGRCCAPLREVSTDRVTELLNQAAHVRLHRKSSEFAVRARHTGWEQALREGLFAALGYKHNAWPMRRLAEIVGSAANAGKSAHDVPVGGEADPWSGRAAAWEARLLGLAGLLPAQLPRGDTGPYVKRLWDIWWRERDAWSEVLLPAMAWRLGGLRPANHPQRRLALAARWLAHPELPGRIEAWLATPDTESPAVARLAELLTPRLGSDDFWACHATLRSAATPRPLPLLGAARLADLAMNVILPWLLARAVAGQRTEWITEVERRYFAWPAGEDNALLRYARQRLFADGARRFPRSAAAQQGLLQVVRDFCHAAGPLCSECRFPGLIQTLPG